MKQYYSIKAVHGDAILLFRVGDFYETFGDDAIRASKILGITLTKRANGSASSVELAGFPYHAVDTYLPKLVRAGERVAICEQLEDPKTTKKIVKRGVIELVTPGVSYSDNILCCKENTFLASVYFGKKKTGVSFLDVSTGEFFAADGNNAYVDKLLANLSPKEVIYPKGYEKEFEEAFGTKHYTYRLDPWMFELGAGREKLLAQFGTTSLKGFGIDRMPEAVVAAGAILYYLEFTEHRNTKHISSIARIDEDRYVWIDRFSIRNLELFTANGGQEGCSLFDVLDRTSSPMGARLLRRWISLPLKDIDRINSRAETVGLFIGDASLRETLCEQIDTVGDLERIISRIAVGRVSPREVVQLKHALFAIEKIKNRLEASDKAPLQEMAARLDLCLSVREKIDREIYPDPSNQIQKGGVIAPGVSIELDDLRNIASHGKEILSDIQRRESEATGIPSLKISFNNVFGYYIEVRNTYKDKVPSEWIRKQTLTGAERYITAELKEYEEKILGAESRILVLEQELFAALLAELAQYVGRIQTDASVIARMDCLLGFASQAVERNYCRPDVNDSQTIDIRAGRHPVIETLMRVGEEYIPNDVLLDDSSQQIVVITGPNMSGKSAILRQTALIVLMAQIGSYVPAAEAHIGVVDKIFTRVGASDNISQGESTFMVEMLESASILNNISERSLVLLDEIGRGTSTYDGISIAWAMVEYIHQHPKGRAKTLFATHYHELNEMEELYERVKNYNVAVREVDRKIIFLRKLVRGGTEHSFGIHVAKMAGMPVQITRRADQILKQMEAAHRGKVGDGPQKTGKAVPHVDGGLQLSMFQLDDPVLKQIRDEIKGLDIDSLTPLEALNKLNEIKKIAGI
ncbi:DNA mismatch repair protein MutS [uncultured Alistipes sp.]|uniref:DNA mismatch repair protein MutS n=1 Tax=uncultured Alistipes sp. TaxID=538949 RepID=UPI0026193E95|nr:DNA mismatch repair protein MutS [uncultured Alistipes sp.]